MAEHLARRPFAWRWRSVQLFGRCAGDQALDLGQVVAQDCHRVIAAKRSQQLLAVLFELSYWVGHQSAYVSLTLG